MNEQLMRDGKRRLNKEIRGILDHEDRQGITRGDDEIDLIRILDRLLRVVKRVHHESGPLRGHRRLVEEDPFPIQGHHRHGDIGGRRRIQGRLHLDDIEEDRLHILDLLHQDIRA